MALYDTSSANELYFVRLGDSLLLSDCVGLSFAKAAALANEKQICLIAVKNKTTNMVQLNPGSSYILVGTSFAICNYRSHLTYISPKSASDELFYIAQKPEDLMVVKVQGMFCHKIPIYFLTLSTTIASLPQREIVV